MSLKSILPWVCVLGLGAGLAWVYAAGQKKDADLAALRAEYEELQKQAATAEEAKKTQSQAESDELTNLRKDREELLRLRNEVRQLRGDKQHLSAQLQTAETQAQGAQAQLQTFRANAAQPGAPGQPNAAADAALRARYGVQPVNSEQAQMAACINNLRMIDGAKQQWALETKQATNATPGITDISAYLRNSVTCPSGGASATFGSSYTMNDVSTKPACKILPATHVLPADTTN